MAKTSKAKSQAVNQDEGVDDAQMVEQGQRDGQEGDIPASITHRTNRTFTPTKRFSGPRSVPPIKKTTPNTRLKREMKNLMYCTLVDQESRREKRERKPSLIALESLASSLRASKKRKQRETSPAPSQSSVTGRGHRAASAAPSGATIHSPSAHRRAATPAPVPRPPSGRSSAAAANAAIVTLSRGRSNTPFRLFSESQGRGARGASILRDPSVPSRSARGMSVTFNDADTEPTAEEEQEREYISIRNDETIVRRTDMSVLRNGLTVIDSCPSCTAPLIARFERDTIDLDNNRADGLKISVCESTTRSADGTPINNIGDIFLARCRARFANPSAEFYLPDSNPPRIRNCFLRPDIVLDPLHFIESQRYIFDHQRNNICSYAPQYQEMYFRNRMLYDQELMREQAKLPENRRLRGTLNVPNRAYCRCDAYHMNRCGDISKPCCSPIIAAIEARATGLQ